MIGTTAQVLFNVEIKIYYRLVQGMPVITGALFKPVLDGELKPNLKTADERIIEQAHDFVEDYCQYFTVPVTQSTVEEVCS